MSKLSSSDLVAIIRAHRADALGADDGDLATQRADALNHYHGRPYGNEVEGRSQVVSRDLAEAVDWALPGIMKVFLQSGTIAEFAPVGPEDEQLAQQESDYLNLVMMRDNPGFMVLHDAVKDTLLLKNGYVKHWWEVEEKTSEETYTGLTSEQITMMLADLEQKGQKVEIVAASPVESVSMPTPVAGAMGSMPLEVWDVRLKVTRKAGRLIWMAVPSEEVRVSKKCRGSLQDSPFTEHVTKKTRSDLIEMGMPRDFVEGLNGYSERNTYSTQATARDSVDDESETIEQAWADRSMDEIEYCEAYLKIDYDGDGVAELRKIVTVSDQIPPGEDWNEQIQAVPLTSFVAKRVPHRHVGESLDDELADLQEIMTVLKRQLLDNIYRVNNSEMAINEDANLRDFMTSTPGGIKRIKGSGPVGIAFAPIVTPPIIDKILPVLDYVERSKETRTGISKATTGLDPDVLQQTTKGAFMENLNRASQKMEMIARMLAETGVKESVLQCHAILMRHQDIARNVQLRGQWVPVNPQQWKDRTDLVVKVGLGTGSEEDKRTKLGMLSQLQGQLLQALASAPPIVYAKMYAMFEDISKTLGADTPEKYAVAPGGPEHQQLMQERKQAQSQGDPRAAAEMAKIQQQGQLEDQRMRMQAEVDRNRQAMEAQQQAAKLEKEAQLEQFKLMLRAQQEQAEAALDMRFQRWKAELDAAVRIQVANIGSKAKVLDAATAAATGEIASEVTQDGMPMQGAPMDNQTMPPDGMME